MLIRKAKYKKVRVWQNQMVSQEVHGCDECKNEIDDFPNEEPRLCIDIYAKDGEHSHQSLHFCSWDCVLIYFPKVKSNYFITLPYIHFDINHKSKKSAQYLIKLLTKNTRL